MNLICKECKLRLLDSSIKLHDNYGKSLIADNYSMAESNNPSMFESRVFSKKNKKPKECVVM